MTIAARFYCRRGDFTLDVDLQIPARGVTALFGRSGSGKTTILRCLAGLEQLKGAQLTVNGEAWQQGRYFLAVHKRPIGYVFQESSLFPHLTVLGNLRYGHRRTGADAGSVSFDETLELLGLEPFLTRYPVELSGGERQRVAIGRALLTSPRLLLMDEPMASLDVASKAEIMPYLEGLHGALDIPLVYVSHAMEEVARLADHMVLLEQGQVLATGPLQEMLTRADLPLAHSDNASAVLETWVAGHDQPYHLTELECSAGRLWVSHINAQPGQRQRIRILARDVTIALSPPQNSSVNNCLAVSIASISDDTNPGHVLLQLRAGEEILLSRITRRSCQRLGLAPGVAAYALVKGVSLG